MNKDNTVLVRAYNHFIPFSKELKPSCDEMYLKLDHFSDHQRVIQKLYIKYYEQTTGETINVWNEEEYAKLKEDITPLLPLTSDYVSTLSFSLNGLVCDDINNFFSKYDVCIIDPLKYHQDDNFISFCVNDTTIKGSVKLSDDAILVIKDETYNLLNDSQKDILNSQYHLEVFNGSLKKGVEEALKKYEYPALDIINSRENKYIADGPEKESAVNFINEYAISNKLSKLRLYDIYTAPKMYEEADIIAQEKISDEIDNSADIKDYYRHNFYEYLVNVASEYGYTIDEVEQYYLYSDFSNSYDVLEELVKYLIERLGFKGYSELIAKYNNDLVNNYKSNAEILNEIQQNKNLK